ncbi:uncharacterized protein LOC6564804 [Drosophila grimshawi]|uniref:GH12283 n=1 Tax=Drosophila grimshawi TaxID=7222 RepID=B4JJC1_DROGR|nr:uncharacterized protein LOC6564804 [Drosophila grimshawi]EDV99673.1 GH12283 [Drosophila grimshawi]
MTTTTTRTTTATMTGSSVLLFCAVLLMSMSCSILAQTTILNEVTTVVEGSGSGSGSDVEIPNITTDLPESTTIVEELTEPTIDVVDTTTEINIEDGGIETTLPPNVPEVDPETTAQPIEDPSTAGSGGQEQEGSGSLIPQLSTSTPSVELTTVPSLIQGSTLTPIAPTPSPIFKCRTSGTFPDINGDCRRYHTCVTDPLTNELVNLEMSCLPWLAFSPKYGRCVRDISDCTNDEFVCESAGRFPGTNDMYYYNCVLSLRGGFHKYIVRCSEGERYQPFLRRCWRYDWLHEYAVQALEALDLAAIQIEQKVFKVEEKQRLKAAKLAEKTALKQQKLEEKLARKAAKEQAKKEAKEAKEQAISLESAEQPSLEN